MADYSNNEKATGLDVLTTLASDDVVVVGDTSDSGKAKVITKTNLKAEMESGLVNATVTDNTASVLDDKIEIISSDDSVVITKTVQNAGTNEKISYNLSASTSSGSTGGVSKISIDTTQVIVTGSGVFAEQDIITPITIPGGTLGTNNAIRFKVLVSSVNFSSNGLIIRVKYGSETLITSLIQSSAPITHPCEFTGYIVANASSSAQKAQLFLAGQSTVQTNSFEDSYGEGTVDSTIDNDLVITLENTVGTASGIQTEGIIVEKIGDSAVVVTAPSVASYSFVQETGSGTDIVVPKPSGLSSGDLMFAHILYIASSSPTIGLPSGWSLVGTPNYSGTRYNLLARKIATAGDTAATDFTFTGSGGQFMAAISRIININTGTPIAVSSVNAGTGSTATATTITPTTEGSLIALMVESGQTGGGYDLDSWSGFGITTDDITWTEIYDRRFTNGSQIGTLALSVGSRTPITATGIGTISADNPTGTVPWTANLVAFNPS